MPIVIAYEFDPSGESAWVMSPDPEGGYYLPDVLVEDPDNPGMYEIGS